MMLKTSYWFRLICCGCLAALSTFTARAQLHIGKPYACKTLSAALALVNSGDTIYVHEGLYLEGNIVVTKPVAIVGINFPVFDGQKKHEVISIKADSVYIRGLKVQRSGYASLDDPGGIKVYDAKYVTIEGNILDDNFFGVYVQYGKHCIIRNNIITSYGQEEQRIGNGIHCWKSDSLQITGNKIRGHRDGIYFEFVTHSVIWRNISTHNVRYGLHFMFSNSDAYISNVFRHNGAGVAVMFTKDVKMFNNTFEQNWGDAAYGLLLKEISDAYIYGNHFVANTYGIYMEGTSRVQVMQNLIEKNGWGMTLQASCMDNTVSKNNFLGNTFDVSTNGHLVLNQFENNYWDKYEGYDLDRNGFGDVPYHPLSLFAVIIEKNPAAMLLFRSMIITLLDRSEKLVPSLTPDNFVDKQPRMRPFAL